MTLTPCFSSSNKGHIIVRNRGVMSLQDTQELVLSPYSYKVDSSKFDVAIVLRHVKRRSAMTKPPRSSFTSTRSSRCGRRECFG